jgi:hypothetical protein
MHQHSVPRALSSLGALFTFQVVVVFLFTAQPKIEATTVCVESLYGAFCTTTHFTCKGHKLSNTEFITEFISMRIVSVLIPLPSMPFN